jgi:hypothetical protein
VGVLYVEICSVVSVSLSVEGKLSLPDGLLGYSLLSNVRYVLCECGTRAGEFNKVLERVPLVLANDESTKLTGDSSRGEERGATLIADSCNLHGVVNGVTKSSLDEAVGDLGGVTCNGGFTKGGVLGGVYDNSGDGGGERLVLIYGLPSHELQYAHIFMI